MSCGDLRDRPSVGRIGEPRRGVPSAALAVQDERSATSSRRLRTTEGAGKLPDSTERLKATSHPRLVSQVPVGGEHPRSVPGQAKIGREADIGLHDRGVDPDARVTNLRSACAPVAAAITLVVICSMTSGPSRRASLRIVDSCGTDRSTRSGRTDADATSRRPRASTSHSPTPASGP